MKRWWQATEGIRFILVIAFCGALSLVALVVVR